MTISCKARRVYVFILSLALLISATMISPLNAVAETVLDDTVIPQSGGIYTIATAEQLLRLSELVANGNNCSGATFRLTANIDLNPGTVFAADGTYSGASALQKFTPIGSSSKQFRGVFDGNGYTIRGIYISDTYDSTGLFGYIYKATIKNLTLANSYITGTSTVGGICGTATNGSTIIDCTNGAYVVGNGNITGGICGMLTGKTTTITACANSAAITSTSNAAGGTENVGVGGVCGVIKTDSETDIALISKSYNLAAVTADGGNIGGVIGFACSPVELCYNAGDICGKDNTGGISGYSYAGNINNCYNLGDITGTTYVGGITGYTVRGVNGAYNIGTITGSSAADGIAGYTTDTPYSCYTTAKSEQVSKVTFDKIANTTALPSGFDTSVWTIQNTTAKYCYPMLIDVINPDLSADDEGNLINEIVLNAAPTNTALPNSESKDVTASYQVADAASTVYSVSIIWGSLHFRYEEGSLGAWNPETHRYDGAKEGSWKYEEGANTITIVNHSNIGLNANFVYNSSTSYSGIQGTFSSETVSLDTAVGTAVDKAPQASTSLTLDGNLPKSTEGSVSVGKVIISFTQN